MSTQKLAFLLSAFIFLLVIDLIRREKLTFKYAVGWLAVSFAGMVCALFHQIVYSFSRWLGFALPSNFIFFAILSIFIFLSLLLTIFLCQLNKRNDSMAQKLGMLEFDIAQLKRQKDQKNTK